MLLSKVPIKETMGTYGAVLMTEDGAHVAECLPSMLQV